MKDGFIDMNIDDALIEKPYGFTIEDEGGHESHFYLYPVTLGKLHLLSRHMNGLKVNIENLSLNPHLEALRVVKESREKVCRIFAYHTLKKKRDIFDNELVCSITDFFSKNASDEDLASLLILILTKDNIEAYKEHLGITKESERLTNILSMKEQGERKKNNFSFGGKSIYGTLIDTACERYGWTFDYVLWGISLVNLQLLLADRIQDVYLSDEDKKYIPSTLLGGGNTINADDKSNRDLILSMKWK